MIWCFEKHLKRHAEATKKQEREIPPLRCRRKLRNQFLIYLHSSREIGHRALIWRHSGVDPFSQFFEQLLVKGFEIFRRTAAYKAVVDNNLLVYPVDTGIHKVGFDGWIGSHGAAL